MTGNRLNAVVAAVVCALAVLPDAAGWEVLLPDGPKPWESTAASTLDQVLAMRVSERLSAHGGGDARLHVGDTAVAKAKGLGSASLEDEEWVVKSFGRDVVVNGGGTRGVLYAVSHFLEDACDVRFWSDDETDVPSSATLDLPPLDMRGRPAFRYRDIYRGTAASAASPRLAVMRRLNRNGDVRIPKELGGGFDYGPPFHCHTFDRYIPWSKYGEAHPEWFSLWKGKRIGGVTEGQLCLSQPEVRRLLLEGVLGSITEAKAAAAKNGEPAPRLYDISQNDGRNRYCECADCTAQAERFGHSGFYLNVVNEIADAVAERHPGVFLTTLAYEFTEELPKGGVVPRPNVIVKLCDTRSSEVSDFDAPCNAQWRRLVEGWGGIAPRLLVWDYAIVYENPPIFLPLPCEYTFADTFRNYARNNVFGIFMEHEHAGIVDMHVMKYYIESRLMEDPGQNVEALVADFMPRYFGEAGRPIHEARNILRDRCRAERPSIPFFPKTADYDFIARADAERMKALFDEAERMAAGDSLRLARVRRARSSTDMVYRLRQVEFDGATGAVAWLPEAMSLHDEARLALVDDPGSPSGKAVRIAPPDIEFQPKFGFELYDAPKWKVVREGLLSDDKAEGYVWSEFPEVPVPSHGNCFIYLTRSWTVQLRLCHPKVNGRKLRLRILSRRLGNVRFIARVEFAP
ncbi:MAG: DUF4838 domain-containing protein [Kiritimatiellae bacterium]|nr:DUF4838 domain-containing protein [Kiritimatiellia bacterium]